MNSDLLNINGEKIGEVSLSDKIFSSKKNISVLHELVVNYQNNQRSGSAHTKTRAEVSGGGIKPWRQKGTGRARVGSIRSPLWRGGGVTFGPRNRDFVYHLPKKKKKLAFCIALSMKLKEKKIFIVEEIKFDYPKTKNFVKILSDLKLKESVFIVINQKDENIIKSCRNIKNVKLSLLNNINIYDLLKYENLLITRQALENLEVWLNNE